MRRKSFCSLQSLCFSATCVIVLLAFYSLSQIYRELPNVVNPDTASSMTSLRALKDSLAEMQADLKRREADFQKRVDMIESDLASRHTRMESLQQRLQLDKEQWELDRTSLVESTRSELTSTSTSSPELSSPSLNATSCDGWLCGVNPCPASVQPVESQRVLLFDEFIGADTVATAARSMNVLIATFEYAGGPRAAGGIGTAYAQLADTLARAGHNVTVLLCAVDRIEEFEWTPWRARLAARNITLEAAPLPELSLTNAGCGWSCIKSYCVFEWLRRLLPFEFDVIHFPENLGLGYFAQLAKRQRRYFARAQFVVGLHGPHVWERDANQRWMATKFDFEVAYQERRSAEWADVSVSPSAFLVDWLRRVEHWRLLPTRTLVLQNVIGDASAAAADGARRWLDGGDVREFVFFGRLETRKGVWLLADAIDVLHARTDASAAAVHARLRNVTLTFVGKDPQLAADTLRRRCVAWPHVRACQFVLDQTREDALAYLAQRGRVALIPSLTENSPYTVLECAQLGVPLLAARVGGIPELLVDDAALFDATPAALADALARALTRGTPYAQLARPPALTRRNWLQLHAHIGALPMRETAPLSAAPRLVSVVVMLDSQHTPAAVEAHVRALERAAAHVSPTRVELVGVTSSAEQAAAMPRVSVHALGGGWAPAGNDSDDAITHAVRTRARGEYVLLLPLDARVRTDDALRRLLELALSANADAVSAQVLELDDDAPAFGESIVDDALDGLWQLPVAELARSLALYVGCGDDVALGVTLNCFGDAIALVRRSALLAVAAARDDGDAWSRYAALALAGYRVTSHVDVLFVRYRGAFEMGKSAVSYSSALASSRVAMRVLQHTPLRALPTHFAHVVHAYEAAVEAHRDAMARQRAKCAQQQQRATTECDVELTTRLQRCESDRVACERAASNATQMLSVALARAPASSVSSTKSTPSPTHSDVSALESDVVELKRKLTKKCAPNLLASSAASMGEATREAGVVSVRDASGADVRQRVLLVRGHEKSGTTWLRALLALHPAINMAPKEFQFNFVQAGVERFASEPWMGAAPALSSLAHQWYDEFVHSMLGTLVLKHPERQWVAEKSPKPIAPVHVGAHYVYLLRDGRDVLVSLFWHHVRLGGFKTWCDDEAPVAADERAAWLVDATHFDVHPERLLSLERCVRAVARHWHDVVRADLDTLDALPAPTRALVVRYEQLLNDTDGERARIYRYLALEPRDARALERWDLTLPGIPEDANAGFFRTGRTGEWRTFFHGDARDWFKQETGSLLIDLGYETGDDW